jgi:hypothetical protein
MYQFELVMLLTMRAGVSSNKHHRGLEKVDQ